MNIFHHLTKEGGNLYLPEENVAAIQGVGTGTTCIITPDIQIILVLPVQQTQRVPSAEFFYKAKTMLDVNALFPTANNHYFPRNFVPVPPFLISVIDKTLEDYGGDATKILLSVIKTITYFDNRIEDED